MRYLTLDELKHQMNVDTDFHDDDEYITSVGNVAEDMTEQLVNCNLDELASQNGGELPSTLIHVIKMLADYFYAVQRGSGGNDLAIPDAVYTMIKLYRDFT